MLKQPNETAPITLGSRKPCWSLGRLATVFIAIGSIGLLTACATPSNKAAMSISSGEQTSRKLEYIGAFKVGTVVGGQETNPLWTSQVSNDAFKSALEDSLKNIKYFSSRGDDKFLIDANLKSLEQPIFGFTFDVSSNVIYRVEGMGVTKSFEIVAVGTATTSDAFLGIERLRIANERSIKNNITKFIRKIDTDKVFVEALTGNKKVVADKRASAISSKCVDLGFIIDSPSHKTCVDKLSN